MQDYLPHFHWGLSGKEFFVSMPNDGSSFSLDKLVRNSERKLALIDRDGVLVVKAPRHQYHNSKSTIHLIEEAVEGVRLLNQNGIPAVVATNQPGIYKRNFSEDDLIEMNMHIQDMLKSRGAKLDAIIYCPHPAATEGDYVPAEQICHCRKPQPGMLNLAVDLYGADKSKTFFFEDFETGIQAAKNAGVNPVYVATEHDEFPVMDAAIKANHNEVYRNARFRNLTEAVRSCFKL